MLRVFEWELKWILFEEVWSYPSSMNFSAARQRLADELTRGNASVFSSRLHVAVYVSGDGDQILIRSKRFLLPLSYNFYYFSGVISDAAGGSVVHGEYRSNQYGRFVHLFIVNLAIFNLMMSVFAVSISLIAALGTVSHKSLQLSNTSSAFEYVLYSVGFAVVAYLLFWAMTLIEKVGRDEIRSALAWIAGGNSP